MADYSELKRKALEIRDEVKIGANTAYRVGVALEDAIKALETENKRAEQVETRLENGVMSVRDYAKDTRQDLDALVVNDLTTGGVEKALSAEMGKALSATLTKLESGIQPFLFAERCPFIKELYLTQDGIEAGVKNVHIIMPGGKYGYLFSNAIMSYYVAETDTFDTKEEAFGIMVIKSMSGNTILGYIITDWGSLDMANLPQLCPLTDIVKDINYSPAIKAYIESLDIANIQENVKWIEAETQDIKTTIFGEEDDEKDFSLLTSYTADSFNSVFFQYPKGKRLSKITQITYKARIGVSNFYLVTINETTATLELVATYTNNGVHGDIITIPIEGISLGDNQYIGINGNFYFGNDTSAQGFTGSNVDVSTMEVGDTGVVALGFVLKNNESLLKEIEELESFDTTKKNGFAIGETLNIPAYEVVLAADGSGDYTNWTDAHTSCRAHPYNTRMIIKPGIYDLPALGGDNPGYDIQYDIVGIGNPILRCVNSSADVGIKKIFAPFMMDYRATSSHRTTRIEGITLIGEGVRYCVHDEMGGLLAASYTHIYKDCCFIHKTAPDTDWAMPRCIGGGLGNNGLIIIDNCEFRSVIKTSVDYHSGFDGAQQSSKVIVSNCTLTNNTVSATTIENPSEKSVMVVRGCILGSAPICTDYQGRVDVEIKQEGNIIV